MHEPDEVLLGFARALRAAGVPVTLDRSRTWLEAAALVDLGDRQATYWAGRATLCACPDDLTRYDQVFDAWFLAKEGLPRSRPRTEQTELVQAPLPQDEREGTGARRRPRHPGRDGQRPPRCCGTATSPSSVGAQKAALSAMFAALHPHAPRRRAHRRTAWRRGEIDAHRTLRTTLRRMGEPGRSSGAAAAPAPAGWCCWSTCPAR